MPGKLTLHERKAKPAANGSPWRVLVADDDEQVHAMTRVLLRDFTFDGRAFEPIFAFSSAEAAEILVADSQIPLALVDVVMESPDAGLRLVRDIRERLSNDRIRIILRTGQPGEAPERDVVLGYDISDYKSKTELTAQKLFTALVGALRAWLDIEKVARLADELAATNAALERKVLERTADLASAKEAAEIALASETDAKRQLRQFLSMMSHEFRTPLAIIDSAAQMLIMLIRQEGDGIQPRLGSIRQAVNRLIGLIDTCLADEQLETGRITLHKSEIDLGALVMAAIDQQRAGSPDREISLYATPLPSVWGDAGMLALVFGNLISNALKYSAAPEPITVSAAAYGNMIEISVTDHGIGVPDEDQSRIFERFFRAGNVQGVPGSGIGLHMVRQIVEMHGGFINVDSHQDDGSTFTVRLWARSAP